MISEHNISIISPISRLVSLPILPSTALLSLQLGQSEVRMIRVEEREKATTMFVIIRRGEH